MISNEISDVTTTNASPLGKNVVYIDQYDPRLLFPISRQPKRAAIGIQDVLPFYGVDIWNGFELSWLNSKGKPMVGIAQFTFSCDSPYIIESKSFKLYLNSFNQTKFEDKNEVQKCLTEDLSEKTQSEVGVQLQTLHDIREFHMENYTSFCLDDLDIDIEDYVVNPNYLKVDAEEINEIVHSHLLKANCLVTGQPDWASIEISYKGNKIDHVGLLRYIISYRKHQEFHEQCIERIFTDILRQCNPRELTVEGKFTRRGGLDINPFRTTDKRKMPRKRRLIRQ